MKPIVSVVVPVYNVSDYIGGCIRSLCAQDMGDYEIVLVDDGSTDQSTAVAEAILVESGRDYRIIRQDNRGVSAARNVGIASARGEFITCVDSDDTVEPGFLSALYGGLVSLGCDASATSFRVVRPETRSWRGAGRGPTRPVLYHRDRLAEDFMSRRIVLISPAVMIRKSFLLNHDVWYHEGMRFSEDVHFLWRLVAQTNHWAYDQAQLYNYVFHAKSTMSSATLDQILTCLKGVDSLKRAFGDRDYADRVISRWLFGIAHSASRLLNYEQFVSLLQSLDIGAYRRSLEASPDRKVRWMTRLSRLSPGLFYEVSRRL